MDYYTEKKKAIVEIDEMFAKGKDLATICFRITTKYGFSKKMILDRIDLLDEIIKNQNAKNKETD